MQQTEQYLVSRKLPRCTCSCFELQEMGWPCEHVMMWDNLEGRNFMKHFHKCWLSNSVKALYAKPIPSFVCNDLPMRDSCCPPAIAVKKGRHRVVRMQKKAHRSKPQEGEVRDEMGYLCRLYPIEDDPAKLDPMPGPSSVAVGNMPEKKRHAKRNQGPNVGKTKCKKCHGVGHNIRTCKALPAEDMDMVEEVQIFPSAPTSDQGITTKAFLLFSIM
jgi:hypothetical protein